MSRDDMPRLVGGTRRGEMMEDFFKPSPPMDGQIMEPEKLPPLSGPVTLEDGTVIVPKEGVKFDSGKLRMDLIPPDAMEALARVLTDGAVKYGGRNWEKGMAWSRPHAALLRHLFAWWGGQDTDPESGHSHLWHVLTNAVFLASYEMRGAGEDDRPVQG